MQYEDVRRELLRQWTYTGGPNEDKAAELYHDDAVLEFPQSGERFEGVGNFTEADAQVLREIAALVEGEMTSTARSGAPATASAAGPPRCTFRPKDTRWP